MKWTAEDAATHNSACKDNDEMSRVWVDAANAARDDGKTDEDCIKAGNDAVTSAQERKLGKDKLTTRKAPNADKIKSEMYRRRAPANARAPASLDAEAFEVDMAISTGAAVRRKDWWDDYEYDEVLSMAPSAVRMARLNDGAPLLDSHNFWGGIGDTMLGSVVPGSARIIDGELIARARFSKNSELSRRLFADLQQGIRIALSAGYRVHAFKEDRTTSPVTRTITDWEPHEVSLVSVPAEQTGTGFRSLHTPAAPPAGNINPRRPSATTRQEKAMIFIRQKGESDADFKARIAAELKTRSPIEGENAEQLAARAQTAFDAALAVEREYEAGVAEERARHDGLRAIAERRANRTARGLDPDGEDERPGQTAASVSDYLAIGRQAGMSMEQVEKYLKTQRNMTLDEFRKIALDHLADQSRRVVTEGAQDTSVRQAPALREANGAYGQYAANDTQREGRMDAAIEALSTRMLTARREPAVTSQAQREFIQARGITDHVARSLAIVDGREQFRNAGARQYMDMGFVEMAAHFANIPIRGLLKAHQVDDILRRAFHSTSDFPAIFENVLNKSLLARYAVAMPTYRMIAAPRTFTDFRPHPQVRAGDFPQPREISETGEIKFGTASDSKETVSVKPYGIAFPISRHMIVNDDLGGIDQILGSTGQGVLRFENTTFFAMLLAGTAIGTTTSEGASLINQGSARKVWTFGSVGTAGANFVSQANTPSAPSIASLSVARQYMRNMKSLDGQFLNVNPKILLTGPVQETVAQQIVTTITPALSTSPNPFQGQLTPVTEASISGTFWALFADPNELPNFVYGFLAGSNGPRIRTEEPFGVQGLRVSLEHDFGVGAIDYRGTAANYGA